MCFVGGDCKKGGSNFVSFVDMFIFATIIALFVRWLNDFSVCLSVAGLDVGRRGEWIVGL